MATIRGNTTEECARLVLETAPRVMQGVRAQMRARRGADLSVPQFRSLAFVGRHPSCSLSEVAQHVGTSLPSMSRLIGSLVERRLVKRMVDSEDRRHAALSLTRGGEKLLGAVRAGTQSFLVDLLSTLSTKERLQVADAMRLLSPLFSGATPQRGVR